MTMQTQNGNSAQTLRTRRPRAVAPPPQPVIEPAHDAFLRLGNLRMKKALRSIRVIGNLSSRRYEYSEAELKLISDTLRTCVDQTMHRFERDRPSKLEDTFQFFGVGEKVA